MATIDLSLLTIPIPEPYDKNTPTKQQENFFYIVNQILDLMKQESFTIFDSQEPNVNISTAGIKEAIESLQWNDATIDLGPFRIILSSRTIQLEPIE